MSEPVLDEAYEIQVLGAADGSDLRSRPARGPIRAAAQGLRDEIEPRQALLEALARAFLENPMNVELHRGSRASRLRANRAGLRHAVLGADPGTTTRVIQAAGRVLGGAIEMEWPRRGRSGPSFREGMAAWLYQGPRALLGWERVRRETMGFWPVEPATYLSVLGVLPEVWGRGFGGALLRAAMDDARRAGRPLFLESDRPRSIAFYRAHGFECTGQATVFGIDCAALIWRPD